MFAPLKSKKTDFGKVLKQGFWKKVIFFKKNICRLKKLTTFAVRNFKMVRSSRG